MLSNTLHGLLPSPNTAAGLVGNTLSNIFMVHWAIKINHNYYDDFGDDDDDDDDADDDDHHHHHHHHY